METEIVTLSIKLPKDFHRRVKIYSAKKGVTIKDLFIEQTKKLLAEEEEAEGQK